MQQLPTYIEKKHYPADKQVAKVGFVWHLDTLFSPMIFRLEYLSLVEKNSNSEDKRIRRATDIICHSSSERTSIFDASQWLKLSNVTDCFTACTGAHSLAFELDNVIQCWSGPL